MTGTPPRLPSMFEQFLSAAASAAAAKSEAQHSARPANPFKKGIRAGSTTDRVLSELRRAFPRNEIAPIVERLFRYPFQGRWSVIRPLEIRRFALPTEQSGQGIIRHAPVPHIGPVKNCLQAFVWRP